MTPRRKPSIEFPKSFLWGSATSAYQVEGSPLADGAGPSIWHRFTRTAGLVRDGDTGDVACDQYRRYADDVALMRELGMPVAQRFKCRNVQDAPPGKYYYSVKVVGVPRIDPWVVNH